MYDNLGKYNKIKEIILNLYNEMIMKTYNEKYLKAKKRFNTRKFSIFLYISNIF